MPATVCASVLSRDDDEHEVEVEEVELLLTEELLISTRFELPAVSMLL